MDRIFTCLSIAAHWQIKVSISSKQSNICMSVITAFERKKRYSEEICML